MRVHTGRRRFAGALVALALVGGAAVAQAPAAGAATSATEDFEYDTGLLTYDPAGVTRDCTSTAQSGFCSLKLDPPCCSQRVRATRSLDVSLGGAPSTVAFWLSGESLYGDVDSDVTLALDHGHVHLHPTGGNNNLLYVSTDQAPGLAEAGSWTTAGTWHEISLRVDPVANSVAVSLDGVRTASAPIHGDASRLASIAFEGVRWSPYGTPIRYDNLTVSDADTVPAPVVEDYEGPNAQTTYDRAVRDCATRQSGTCSLYLDPPCCSVEASAQTRVDMPLPAEVSFWIQTDSIGGDLDSDVTLNLDTGSIRLHPTDSPGNNTASLFGYGPTPSAPAFATWSPAGQWHEVKISLDPNANTATATINGRSGTVGIPADAVSLTSVKLAGIRWGSGSPIRYDNLRVEPGNRAPSVTLWAPGPDAVLPYITEDSRGHEFKVGASDPERDQWSARILVKRARTGEVVHDLTTPTLTHGTPYPQWVGKLEPGDYRWSAVATDVKGAVGPTVEQWFTVRPLAFTEGFFAGLGDSYASGEGAPDVNQFGWDIYEPGTNESGNQCHRSVKSYQRLVSTDPGMPAQDMVFRACSGAETRNLWATSRYGETPQFSYLNDETTLVTMSIGGNDSGFATVLEGCIKDAILDCPQDFDELVARRFARLDTDLAPDGTVPAPSASDVAFDPDVKNVNPLSDVYRRLRVAAPRARVLIVGYPRFFPVGGGGWCWGVTRNEQAWMNEKVRQMNDIVESRAKEHGFEYVDVEQALNGHELCGDGDDWMNGLTPQGDFTKEAFHPNREGHAAEASIVRAAIANPPTERSSVCPGCVSTTYKSVPAGQRKMTAAIRWPGGDVGLALVSPSGRRITRQTAASDVRRQTGSLSEVVTVDYPEAGSWGIELTGADVRVGDAVDLSLTWQQARNAPPTASFTHTDDKVVTVSVNGMASDTDGTIVEYVWDWGDGISTSGTTTPSHRYPGPGTYTITLQARDDAGGTTSFSRTVTVRGYTWSGFYSPIKAPVARNSATAGKAVKLKWRLTFHDGTVVSDPQSFVRARSTRVNCDGTPSTAVYTVSPDAAPVYGGDGTWLYTWNTDAAWKGTCRRFEIDLADQVTGVAGGRYALFDFR